MCWGNAGEAARLTKLHSIQWQFLASDKQVGTIDDFCIDKLFVY
jgi:hypothetical protein